MGPITFKSNNNHYHNIAISSLPLPLHTFWKYNHYHYHYLRNVVITITHYFWLLIPQLVITTFYYIKIVYCKNRDCQQLQQWVAIISWLNLCVEDHFVVNLCRGTSFVKFYFLSIFIHLKWESSLIGCVWCTDTGFYIITYIFLKKNMK